MNEKNRLTSAIGRPTADNQNTQTAGLRGPAEALGLSLEETLTARTRPTNMQQQCNNSIKPITT